MWFLHILCFLNILLVFAIILCSTTAVTAMISYIAQGRIYEGFGGVCILESHIKFKEVPDVIRPTKLYNEYDSFFEQGKNYINIYCVWSKVILVIQPVSVSNSKCKLIYELFL